MGEKSLARLGECEWPGIRSLLERYRLELVELPAGAELPGSFWGAPEAGLVANRLYARPDTPLHSILHETGHYICMDSARRARLDRDAGGDHAEETGVCYLQILLADHISGFGRDRCMGDMDTWGYSFRLGSARAWFEQDAADARDWLLGHGLVDGEGKPTGRLRGDAGQAEMIRRPGGTGFAPAR